MIGKYDEIRTQVVFDHISTFGSSSRTETRRSLRTSPFDDSQRQQAVEMIERIAGGDEAALGAFYQRFAALLFSIAAKVVGDLQEAEEVLQDSARLVWERAPLYNPALGRPLSWAVVITRNKAIDRLRALQRESEAIAKITAQATAEFSVYGGKVASEAIGSEECDILRYTQVIARSSCRVVGIQAVR
jgi:Sigma-70 region 2